MKVVKKDLFIGVQKFNINFNHIIIIIKCTLSVYKMPTLEDININLLLLENY